jgi:hypothetical protein
MDAVIRSGRMDAVGCPGCDRMLAFDSTTAGQVVICPSCQRRIKMPTALEMQGGTMQRPAFESRSSTTFDSPREAPRPLIQRDDPYASPPSLPSPIGQSQTDYSTAGWFLFGMSVLNLGYDFVWSALMALGALAPAPANGNQDAAIGFAFFFVWSLISIAMHSLSLIAGLRMTQRRSLSLVRAGAIASLIPCGICGIFQLFIGIWAVVVAYGRNAPQDFFE